MDTKELYAEFAQGQEFLADIVEGMDGDRFAECSIAINVVSALLTKGMQTRRHSNWQTARIEVLQKESDEYRKNVIALEIELDIKTRRLGELELIAPKIVDDEIKFP